MRRPETRHAGGFTIVELVTVMVVIGVLAAVAIPKLTGNTGFAGAAWRSDIVGALRYAQKTAVGHRRLVCATLAAASVTLTIAPANPATSCTTAVTNSTGEPYVSQDATIAAGGDLVGKLYFQPDGTITTNAAGGTLAAGVITVTEQPDITVAGATGYVE
jgi:MSHA pilin protein MshC